MLACACMDTTCMQAEQARVEPVTDTLRQVSQTHKDIKCVPGIPVSLLLKLLFTVLSQHFSHEMQTEDICLST